MIQALASQPILKNIGQEDCYLTNSNHNQAHLAWLWTLHLLGLFMAHGHEEVAIIHNVALFVRQHFDRFVMVLETANCLDKPHKDSRSIQPSLAYLEELKLAVSVIWMLSQHCYIWKTTCPREADTLLEKVCGSLLGLFSSSYQTVQPLSSLERAFAKVDQF